MLGDIEVYFGGQRVNVGHVRQRSVLAVLLAEANRVVPADQLVARVWGEGRLPARPASTLQTYVSLLRRALAAGDIHIARYGRGYKAVLDAQAIDLHRFRGLLTRARAAADDEATDLFEEALGLWRGEPFAGLDTPWASDVRAALAMERHTARLDLADIQLRRGQHAALLAGLTAQAGEHPFDERLAGQLMLAFYRCGRQADALAHYQRIRAQLADELGTDPGPMLNQLHQHILTADPALAAPALNLATRQARPPAVPRQLPAAPRLFTGRDRELAWLTKTLDQQTGSGATPVISAIGGTGGIGKTWLALHWAHQHADRFPEGQLYVNLRGFDPSGQPVSVEAAVRGFLDALGVAPAAIPPEPDAQVGLYRSLLADKRMLILMDNAREAAQVVPLLPGSPTCTVLITSRRKLTGLITAHSARTLDLETLPEHEARTMLARHLGDDRIAAEPDAVTTLLAWCAGLPLALSIIAARAINQPDLPLAVLADELQDASTRLDALDAGDLTANLRAALSWSYDALNPDAARALDLLALAPGPDISAIAAARLTGLPLERLRTVLRDLERAVPQPTPAPRHLPAPPQMFTGRTTELADLEEIHNASTVVITALDGMAGVGKTALAVQAAHHMVDRYPDGQLFIDLHGYTEGVAPVEPGEALDRMLRALAVAGERIPAGLDERAALYRSRLAGQRMMIVLDNAATDAQVTPLLPGAPGCVVLVTSRRRLVGLDPTHTLSLDTLPAADAVALFRRSVSHSRLAGEPPQLLAELVELCAGLPLAIRIAAARLRSHPAWNLEHLVRRLRVQQDRLLELAAGQRSVTAALDLSYQDLSADLQRTYRRLGLSPGADIDAYAAAALLDTTRQEAGQALEQLLDAHLLQETVPGRYRFHDLTRAHAAHTATRDETEEGGRKALDRLLDYYRHTAAVAMDAAYPYERERRPQVPPVSTPIPVPPDPAQALGWLDNELANLLAAASYAAEHDRPTHLHHLSTILHRHLRNRGYCHDAVTLHHQALQLARATGDQAAQIAALIGLGHIHRLQSRSEQATDHFRQALQLARASGHQAAEPEALIGLGHMHMLHGRYQQAIDHYQQALQFARATDQSPGAQLGAQVGLGIVHRRQGRHEQATHHYQQALQLARTTSNRPGEMDALIGLGHIQRRQGRYQQAIDHYQQALQLARATGNRNGEMQALTGLGQIGRIQGRYQQATDHYQQLLDLARQSDSRNWQFEAQQGLGRLQHTDGHPEAALTHHHHALALATELSQPGDQARAHDGLAHAHHALHQLELARTHWQHALNILTRLGIDHTDDEETATPAVRTHIANLHHQAAAPKERTAPRRR